MDFIILAKNRISRIQYTQMGFWAEYLLEYTNIKLENIDYMYQTCNIKLNVFFKFCMNLVIKLY